VNQQPSPSPYLIGQPPVLGQESNAQDVAARVLDRLHQTLTIFDFLQSQGQSPVPPQGQAPAAPGLQSLMYSLDSLSIDVLNRAQGIAGAIGRL
jgi:hypothetical protein